MHHFTDQNEIPKSCNSLGKCFIIIHHLCSAGADAGDATYAQPIRKKKKARKNSVTNLQ